MNGCCMSSVHISLGTAMTTPGALQTLRTESPASGWVPTVPNGNRLQGNSSALVHMQRGSEVPSKEGEEGAALPGAARHLCRSHVTTEAPPDSKMGPCWVCSAPGTTLRSRDACALLLKLLFLRCLSCN